MRLHVRGDVKSVPRREKYLDGNNRQMLRTDKHHLRNSDKTIASFIKLVKKRNNSTVIFIKK